MIHFTVIKSVRYYFVLLIDAEIYQLYSIPYSGSFSRANIFADFADFNQATKI